MGLHSAGTSPGILGYIVFQDLWASTVLGLHRMSRNPGILSIQGSMGLHSAGNFQDVLGIPG